MSERQRVLIVDDEPRNQRIVAETLEDIVEFKLAASGDEALKIAGEYLPDLVLLDIMMSGTDGYEVCRRIKAEPRFNLTKVILVSGKAMIEERLKGYAVGADDYMTKPFVPDELLAKAKVFLRLTKVERELAVLNHTLEEKVKERTEQLLSAEAKLVNAAKMAALGEMAGGVAHEINTPLGTIGLLAGQLQELLGDESLDKAALTVMSHTIEETVKRISTIIQGLRTFARDGSQDGFSSVPLRQIIDSTLTLCREKIKHGDIKLQLEAFPDDYRLRCRPVQISQVLLNLLSNSCDAIATLPDKWIKIGVEKADSGIRIVVTDSGKGISPELQERIFQPFFTTKDIGRGVGLGLSISKGIMDAHQGALRVDRQSENTRFVIECPQGK